jgi:hypothetical protein
VERRGWVIAFEIGSTGNGRNPIFNGRRQPYRGSLENNMDDNERRCADAWINERYLFLQHRSQRPTIEWLLDTAEVAVVRHGARIVQIDPGIGWKQRAAKTRRKPTTSVVAFAPCTPLLTTLIATFRSWCIQRRCTTTAAINRRIWKIYQDRRTGTTWRIKASPCTGRRCSRTASGKLQQISIAVRLGSPTWDTRACWR